MSTKKKVFLTLEQRVAAIKLLEQGKSAKSIATQFGCGRTQIQGCGKRKAEVLAEYEKNANCEAKRQRTSLSVNHDLDGLLVRWISECNNRRIGLSGPLIQEKARKLASELGLSDFKASNGWLEKFRKRSNIVFRTVSGERGDVNQNIVENWKERLPTVCQGYEPCDIFNMDETGLFYKQGKSTSFSVAGTDLAGGKRAKDRITVALCASMTGEKLKPLVIGKSRKPRCFSRVNVDALPVIYSFNKKSWMNSKLFEEWLLTVDKQMKRQKRNILLLLDNAPSHPHIQMTNVKLVFLPANTTSVVQPMDQGIIQTMKLKFYQQQSQHIINEMEKSTLSGTELLKQITVLDTIYWINRAWKAVDATTIMKCFDKCGFDKVRQGPIETESDCDSDDDIPLIELARSQKIYGKDIRDMINDDIPTCDNNEINWDLPATELLNDNDSGSDSDIEVEVSTSECEPKAPCTLIEARAYVQRLKEFACEKGHAKLLNSVMEVSSIVSDMSFNAMTVQPKISDFFKK